MLAGAETQLQAVQAIPVTRCHKDNEKQRATRTGRVGSPNCNTEKGHILRMQMCARQSSLLPHRTVKVGNLSA